MYMYHNEDYLYTPHKEVYDFPWFVLYDCVNWE